MRMEHTRRITVLTALVTLLQGNNAFTVSPPSSSLQQRRSSFGGISSNSCPSNTYPMVGGSSSCWNMVSTSTTSSSMMTSSSTTLSTPKTRTTLQKKTKKKKASSSSSSSSRSKSKSSSSSSSTSSAGATALRRQMLSHDLLTRDEDFEMGFKIQRANRMKSSMMHLLEQKRAEHLEEQQHENYSTIGKYNFFGIDSDEDHDDDEGEPIDESLFYASGISIPNDDDNTHMDEELHNLQLYSRSSFAYDYRALDTKDKFNHFQMDNASEDTLLFRQDHLQNQRILSSMRRRPLPTSMNTFDPINSITNSDDDELDDSLLTDDDIIYGLDLPGGRAELRTILWDGAVARNTLIRCNIRLVYSIAKKWARNFDNNGADNKLVNLYAGTSTRPSLDEVVQEGILGLATAASRYDSSRKLRFSTYATHWITNSVRICFQQASTGVLKVPAPYHDIKSRYKRIMKEHIENSTPIPSDVEMADQVGVSVNRLRKALFMTRPLLSLDAPLFPGGGPVKGSAAGEGTSGGLGSTGDTNILLSDLMMSTERNPEEHVEWTLLRQCLEHAMATELSPHERDIVRLRLGLDDGVERTFKQVSKAIGSGISIAEIRSTEKRAFRKMSSPYAVHTRQLLSYLDFCGGDLGTIR